MFSGLEALGRVWMNFWKPIPVELNVKSETLVAISLGGYDCLLCHRKMSHQSQAIVEPHRLIRNFFAIYITLWYLNKL